MDLKEKAWSLYCTELDADAVSFAIGELLNELCQIVSDDFIENENHYEDMLWFCVDRVNSKGYRQNPRHGTRVPAFPPFTEELHHRSRLLLEAPGWGFDTHDIIQVFSDATEHYLGWCKEVLSSHWSSDETEHFVSLLNECCPERIPLLVPVDGTAKIVVFPPQRERQ